jgi:hypothetical protein
LAIHSSSPTALASPALQGTWNRSATLKKPIAGSNRFKSRGDIDCPGFYPRHIYESYWIGSGIANGSGTSDDTGTLFSRHAFCVKLLAMGNKDKGKKETKKAPKPKPKPEPSRREIFTPAPPAK